MENDGSDDSDEEQIDTSAADVTQPPAASEGTQHQRTAAKFVRGSTSLRRAARPLRTC